MKLLFKQRLFSWLDSYDVYDEDGNTVYSVKGVLSFGHCLEIYDASGTMVGKVKEEILTFLPRFRMYLHDNYIGEIKKEFTFFRPKFTLDCNGWSVDGDFWQWEYDVNDPAGHTIMHASKELFHLTDTYIIDVNNPEDQLLSLMIVLAIDAAKCSQSN